jgi:hypothetical protein
MGLKGQLKLLLLGSAGSRPRRVSRGLLRGAMFNIDTANKSMRLLGLDEAEVAGWTRQLTVRAGIAVDIGTSDGWYATYYALQSNIQRVYTFEPDDLANKSLRQNLALNGPDAVHKCVLSSKFAGSIDDATTCRLDSVLANEHQPIVMKIDVEGAELDVLKGAEQTLRRLRCGLVIETHSANLERDCQAFLHSLGYQTHIVKNGWYRTIVPESRDIPHNRWLVATND